MTPAKPPLAVIDGGGQPVARIGAERLSDIDLTDMWTVRTNLRWRYVSEWKTWLEWQPGVGWCADRTGSVRATIVQMMQETGAWPEVQRLNASERRKLHGASKVDSIAKLASVHRDCAMIPDEWDADPMRLGVPGGTIDLTTGRLGPPQETDYITKRCAVAPAPGKPKLWLAHLQRTQGSSQETIAYLQRFFGYMLTGRVGEAALLFLYGTGRNGKGTIVETVIRLMGSYGYAAPVDLLMEQRAGHGHPVDLAMLKGMRGVSCSEPPQGARWDESRIKWLTGSDTMTARKMGENFSSFQATHKLIVMGNHKPTLRTVDEAIKARFNIIPFTITIPPDERDPQFMDKLQAEWPQILQWMIDGCLMWQKENGLKAPASMRAATDEYLDDEDSFGQFIAECCDRDPVSIEQVAVLYREYDRWAERVGEHALSRKPFTALLYETPGVTRSKGAASKSVVGLRVRVLQRELRPMSDDDWRRD